MASTTSPNVIVFGPTGGVGGSVAIEAQKRGAHVWLGMRDPNKTIQGIEKDAPGYTRVQADLSKPDTLVAAIKESGAKTAFVYLMFEFTEGMKSTWEALKSAGVTYVVFLSSYTVQGAASEESNMKDMIGRAHAEAEVALEASGLAYSAIRPAYFNTNVFWFYGDPKQSKIGIMAPDAKLDYIAPADIGAVCGAILADASLQKDRQIVYLCGPELLTQREAWTTLGEVTGFPREIEAITGAQWRKIQEGKVPEGVLETMAATGDGPDALMPYPADLYAEAAGNVEKFSGRPATTWVQWLEQHKGALRP